MRIIDGGGGRVHCRLAGMTLLEVLAAVFVLGMGLIMVAGAFPVGVDQTKQAVEQTDGGVLGHMALEICRSQKLVRKLTAAQYGLTYSFPRGGPNEPWRVWNGYRLFYLEPRDAQGNLAESAMWPPRSDDYVWRPFLTRLSATNEAPLYRLTIVIVRYMAEANPQAPPAFVGWDLYNPAVPNYNPDAAPDNAAAIADAGLRLYSTSKCSQRTLTASGSSEYTAGKSRSIRGGDYIMDRRTGLCYQVERSYKVTGTDTLVVGTDPSPAFPTSATYNWLYSFGNVVGIYHTLISE